MTDPEIIYEDPRFVVLSKPSGMLVHRTRGRDETGTLADWLVERYPELKKVGDAPDIRPGIVHRLDKDTSGVMVIARTQEYFEHLKSLFVGREIKKTYLAVVFGAPKERVGVIRAPIGIKAGTTKRSIHSEKFSKEAVTEYEFVADFPVAGDAEKYSLLAVRPKTGRTHQIRVHLASMGNSVVGDPLYGRKKQPLWAGRLMLHAWRIEFPTKDGERLRFEADPPDEFRAQELSTSQTQ